MALCRFFHESICRSWGWVHEGRVSRVDPVDVGICLTEPGAEGLLALAKTGAGWSLEELASARAILPPIDDRHEVWAAGVTYESSKFARMAESEAGGDFYAKVYVADDKLAVVTSANMTDGGLMRNFEYGVKITDTSLVSTIKRDVTEYAAL